MTEIVPQQQIIKKLVNKVNEWNTKSEKTKV